MKFEELVETFKRYITTVVKGLIPVPEEVRPFWTTPDTLTEFSLGLHQESVFLRYQCGDAIGDEYPHNNAANIEEFTQERLEERFEYSFDVQLEGDEEELAMMDLLDMEEDEWYENLSMMRWSLIRIALAIVLAEYKSKNQMGIAFSDTIKFNFYDDYEDAMGQCEAVPSFEHDFDEEQWKKVSNIIFSTCENKIVAEFLLGLRKKHAALANKGLGGTELLMKALEAAPEVRKTLFN